MGHECMHALADLADEAAGGARVGQEAAASCGLMRERSSMRDKHLPFSRLGHGAIGDVLSEK